MNYIKYIKNLFFLGILVLFNIKSHFEIFINNKRIKCKYDYSKKHYGGRGIYLLRENYDKLLKFLHKLIKKNDVIIDCGANQGIFSLAFASISFKGMVYIIEPLDVYNKIIKYNFKINNLKNYKIFNNVVSNKRKYYNLDISKGNVSGSIVRNFGTRKINIQSITIDNLVKKQKIKEVDFIKMDIEGAEQLAIEGAYKTIKKFQPIMSIETNEKDFKKIKLPVEYLKFIFDNQGNFVKINKVKRFHSNLLLIPKSKIRLLNLAS